MRGDTSRHTTTLCELNQQSATTFGLFQCQGCQGRFITTLNNSDDSSATQIVDKYHRPSLDLAVVPAFMLSFSDPEIHLSIKIWQVLPIMNGGG